MALRVRTQILRKILHRYASGTPSTSGGNEKQSNIKPIPHPGTLKEKELKFDEKTHTGQVNYIFKQ